MRSEALDGSRETALQRTICEGDARVGSAGDRNGQAERTLLPDPLDSRSGGPTRDFGARPSEARAGRNPIMKENAVAIRTEALARPYSHRAGSRLALESTPQGSRVGRRSYAEAKAVLDYVLASLLLVLFLPVLFVCALLVKLSSGGPVFYRQLRVGQHGRLFEIIKLRTMRINAERETGPVWARDKDPRVTWIGRLLRRSHLDELPQLFNVLRGEMSLVGPRPERPIFVDEFNRTIRGYYRRLAAKPGITGLAQVRYRYDETLRDVRKKLAYDLLYTRRMCWYLDLSICVLTVGKLLDRGAK